MTCSRGSIVRQWLGQNSKSALFHPSALLLEQSAVYHQTCTSSSSLRCRALGISGFLCVVLSSKFSTKSKWEFYYQKNLRCYWDNHLRVHLSVRTGMGRKQFRAYEVKQKGQAQQGGERYPRSHKFVEAPPLGALAPHTSSHTP